MSPRPRKRGNRHPPRRRDDPLPWDGTLRPMNDGEQTVIDPVTIELGEVVTDFSGFKSSEGDGRTAADVEAEIRERDTDGTQ